MPLGRNRYSKAQIEEKLRRIDELVGEVKKLPVRDGRATDAILGYDDHGLFESDGRQAGPGRPNEGRD